MDIEEELREEAQNNVNYLKMVSDWVRAIDLNAMFSTENVLRNANFILFLFVLVLIYIGNTHEMQTTTRDIDRKKQEIKQVRWQYMSARSELMYNCKQTEVAVAVKSLGLKELTSPPHKIVIEKGEY